MNISVRVKTDIITDSKYWDNDLGWVKQGEVLESGYIFQSDKMTDDEVLSILDRCQNVWDDGHYMHGDLIVENLIAGVFVWLNNPKLEDYPLLSNSEKYLAKLGI